MTDRSPLRRFVEVSRDFGFVVALRVAYSAVRGWLRPALALSKAPVYGAPPRELSILLSTAEHGIAVVDAVIELLARRSDADWEVCICERVPAPPAVAQALARLRGTQPWIRIVTTDRSVDDATAARWTVEQATGRYVVLVAPRYAPEAGALAGLLGRLRDAPATDAAALALTDGAGEGPPTDCVLLLERKSAYLAALPGGPPLTAPVRARHLDGAGMSPAYSAARAEP